MPSPVLMLALVVYANTLPQPPVVRMTALASRACTLPLPSSIATTPWQRPSATSSRVTNHSS